jgi:hypothetical protein
MQQLYGILLQSMCFIQLCRNFCSLFHLVIYTVLCNKVGEYAYTPEYTLGNFSCSGEHGESCKLLVETFSSSAEQCNVIQSYFSTCDNEFTFQDNGCKFKTMSMSLMLRNG